MSDIKQLESDFRNACWAYVFACARYGDQCRKEPRNTNTESVLFKEKQDASLRWADLHEQVKAAVIEGGGV